MAERGVYASERRGRQLLRFDGFRYGSITPTDIDAAVEYQNRIWLLYEAKLRDKEVPYGQKLALQRWIVDTRTAGKSGIAMIVEHTIQDTMQDIYLEKCTVRELCTTENVEWRPPKWELTAKELSDKYIEYAMRRSRHGKEQ